MKRYYFYQWVFSESGMRLRGAILEWNCNCFLFRKTFDSNWWCDMCDVSDIRDVLFEWCIWYLRCVSVSCDMSLSVMVCLLFVICLCLRYSCFEVWVLLPKFELASFPESAELWRCWGSYDAQSSRAMNEFLDLMTCTSCCCMQWFHSRTRFPQHLCCPRVHLDQSWS